MRSFNSSRTSFDSWTPLRQCHRQLLECVLCPNRRTTAIMNMTSPPTGVSSTAITPRQQMTRLLPYVDTLHYPGCGCPLNWTRGSRVCDLVDVLFTHCHKLYTAKLLMPMRPLQVAYMLPHHNITGGMKCLIEHLRLLKSRGHTTIAVHRSDSAATAMPPWTDVAVDVDIVCSMSQRLADVYPTDQIDVVVVGIFHQIAELLEGVPVPVVYWEQGHEWVFGDPIRLQCAQNYIKQVTLTDTVAEKRLPVPLVSVSTAIQDILLREFGRLSLIVPNGIDCNRFYPADIDTPTEAATTASHVCLRASDPIQSPAGDAQESPLPTSLLLVGNPTLPLKGFDSAIQILMEVGKIVPIRVTWVCQVHPSTAVLPILDRCDIDITYIVSPDQNDIPGIYRRHDVFLFTSRYEAWGMPVLEAMASGLPVVTTDCFGVRSFAKHKVNCFMAEPADLNMLSLYVVRLCENHELRRSLGANARETAKRFSQGNVLESLEAVLYSLTACSEELSRGKQTSIRDIQITCLCASDACSIPRRAAQ